jgi:phytoene dehydrogenase-like protein
MLGVWVVARSERKAIHEVAIIGAGIGGLMAGAWLAARGYKVTVFEKATTVGGNAGWYIRRGRMVPTGATIAFGLENNGLLQTLLHDAGVSVDARMLDYPMDVVLSDRTVRLVREREAWEAELRSVFAERGDAVVAFWRELAMLSDDVFAVSAAHLALPLRRWTDVMALVRFAIHRPLTAVRLIRYAPMTVEGLLKKHQLADYKPLRELLNAQLVDAAQTDVRHAALVPSSLALDIYRRGSFALVGGLGTIARALEARIREAGGTIQLASSVREVRVDKVSKRWVVATNKSEFLFDAVIDNSGQRLSEKSADFRILSQRGITGAGVGEGTAVGISEGWGAFRIDALLHRAVLDGVVVGELPFAFQIMPDVANAREFGDEHGPVYATFHQALDAQGEAVDGEVLMTVSVHTDAHSWESLDKETYKLRKQRVQDAMLAEVRKVVPTFDQHVIHVDAGTPKTYKKYVGKLEVGGAPLTIKNALLAPKSLYTKQPNYYLAGENVFPGPGTLSAALSGFFAARALDRDGGRMKSKGSRGSKQ